MTHSFPWADDPHHAPGDESAGGLEQIGLLKPPPWLKWLQWWYEWIVDVSDVEVQVQESAVQVCWMWMVWACLLFRHIHWRYSHWRHSISTVRVIPWEKTRCGPLSLSCNGLLCERCTTRSQTPQTRDHWHCSCQWNRPLWFLSIVSQRCIIFPASFCLYNSKVYVRFSPETFTPSSSPSPSSSSPPPPVLFSFFFSSSFFFSLFFYWTLGDKLHFYLLSFYNPTKIHLSPFWVFTQFYLELDFQRSEFKSHFPSFWLFFILYPFFLFNVERSFNVIPCGWMNILS